MTAKNCIELYKTIQDYTGQYGTMKDYAGCMTILHHCKIGYSTVKAMARHNYGLQMTMQDYTGLNMTTNYYLNYVEPYWNIMDYTDLQKTKQGYTGLNKTMQDYTQ